MSPTSTPSPTLSSSRPWRDSPGPPAGPLLLGRLRVEERIGEGGMATVHRARLDGPGGFCRTLAVKRIHPRLAEHDDFIDMFLDEARLAAAISHPNVAQVFALGKDDETYWLAMEYLRGASLREVMTELDARGRRMVWPVAAQIVAMAADGLHAAHELRDEDGQLLQVVHRDATPHNIFVTAGGVVKVVDFGVAKARGRLNATIGGGTVKGKLAYMSPEQVNAGDVDRRADVYALGVVLWELVTGRRLFRRDNDAATFQALIERIIPAPRTLRRDCADGLEYVILQALAPDRDERYPTANALAEALRRLLVSAGVSISNAAIGDLVPTREPSPVDLESITVVMSPELSRS